MTSVDHKSATGKLLARANHSILNVELQTLSGAAKLLLKNLMMKVLTPLCSQSDGRLDQQNKDRARLM